MTKLTDAQNIIVTKTFARAPRYENRYIVISHETSGLSCDKKAYKAAINGLIRRGIVENVPGLQRVEEGDFEHNGQTLMLSKSFLAEEATEKPKKVAPAINVAAAPAAPVPTPKKAKKEAVVAIKVGSGDEDEFEGDGEGSQNGSVVKEDYRRKYSENKAAGGTGHDCNDALAKFMCESFVVETRVNNRRVVTLNVAALMDFAAENNVSSERVPYLNNGQKRMIIGNMIRKRLRKGHDVTWRGKVVLVGEKSAD